MCKPIFYKSKHCENLAVLLQGGEKEMSCCGEPMTRLEANTSEGASEKHLPVVKKEGDKIHVQVGSVSHPMSEEHSIQWIYLATRQGGQIKQLESHQPPEACFSVCGGDEPLEAYAWCNLHGLWKTKI